MSPSITLSSLGWSTPDGSPVLTNLEFSFTAERIGLVGRNGVGKSSLLALIAGARMPSTGKVTVNGKTAMLRQAVQVDAGETIADLFGAREALALLAKAEAGAATIAELEACDWTLPARIDAALADVGLDAAPDRLLSTLSGGQRTRAALAGAILAEPDFLLLDEPTNNMDAQGRATVAALLARWRGGVILVSHDRALLETMDAIAEMTMQGIARYGGGWSAYRARKATELAAAQADLAHAQGQAADIARKTQIAAERKQRRDAAGARKGAKGDMPRILIGARKQQAEASRGEGVKLAERRRHDAAEAAAAARARIEHVESLGIALPPTGLAAGQRVLTLDHVTAGRVPDAPVLHDFSLHVRGPERIAVTGPNGAGKSTLLHVIAGDLPPLAGGVVRPLPCALLDQRASLLDPALSIADNFARRHPGATRHAVHAALARFCFRADMALQQVASLSGGQLLRAALACVLGGDSAPPLLLLDEPSNHLDIDSVEAVERALAGYDGALIVVSHDPAFLDAIDITRQIELPQ